MNAALIVTWKVPFPGREGQALGFAAESNEYWGKLAADGKCTAPEWYFLPDGWAMWIVRGDRQVLDELIAAEPTAKLLVRGLLLMEGWQYRLAETGSGAERFMTGYAAVGSELGLL